MLPQIGSRKVILDQQESPVIDEESKLNSDSEFHHVELTSPIDPKPAAAQLGLKDAEPETQKLKVEDVDDTDRKT